MIVVNTAWRGQRITGQQRYASEIAERMLCERDVMERPRHIPTNKWAAWLAVQGLAAPRGDDVLVTLTSRGPLWHPNHVVTVHDHFVLTNPEWYTWKYVTTHAPVLRAQIKTARALVFVSDATRERHHELFGDKKPWVVAPNGVHVPESIAPRSDQCGRPYYLVVGSSDPRKNIEGLVRAYRSLPNEDRSSVDLVVAGGASGAIFRNEAGEEETATPGVRRLGYVSEGQLWALYKNASALIVPSFDEGFGLPLVEAAAVGTPLILSDIPVFRWIAGASALYFDPNDRESMTEALRQGLRSLPAPPGVEQRFNWVASAQSVLDLARSLI